ncbi:g11785 [Coccomyxa viridis]|uniref:Guanine deaminase n=1 Tax=Coccomyxa viridis TaxID=1274662 RepID=A0ABP1G8R3_9CHLO
MKKLGLQITVHNIPEGRFMCPGFIDLHIHAPQYSYTGTATDRPLMDWLDHYTFPREAQMQDLKEAKAQYSQLVQRLISNGTTTAVMFGSLHLEPTMLLADTLHQAGLRAYVGKVCMDRNSKDYYQHSLEQNLADTEAFVRHVRSLKSTLVHPVVTPRFVPSCSPSLLQGLGRLAQEHDCHVQSHISESLDNDAFVHALHPEVNGRDARLYEQAGLLTQRTVMAHGVTLTTSELRLLADRGTAIAHCPLSNFYFADVPLDVQRCLKAGVKVGLGTDVAGGYSPSMLSAMRSAVITSKAVRMMHIDAARRAPASCLSASAAGNDGSASSEPVPAAGSEHHEGSASSPALAHQREHAAAQQQRSAVEEAAARGTLGYKEAFWLATMGGAHALGLQDTVGSFRVGKEFDAIMVDTELREPFDVFSTDSLLDRFEKFVNLGDDRNVRAVWIQGGLVIWK